MPPSNLATERAQGILLHGFSSIESVPGFEREDVRKEVALTGRIVLIPSSEPFQWESKVCCSASELQQTLQWSAGLAAWLGPAPLLRASHAFIESLQTTVFSVSVVVQARRVVAAIGCEDVTSKLGLGIPTDDRTLDDFVSRYGDTWVQSVLIGGHMQGVYTFYAQNRKQAKEVASAIELLVSTGSVRLGPSFSHQLKTLAKDSNVNVGVEVSVAGLANPPKITEDTMADFASGFGAMKLDQPEVLSVQAAGYEKVQTLREVFEPVARNRILLCGQGSRKKGLLRQWLRLKEIVNQCKWVEGTYAVYGVPQDPTLVPNLKRLWADIREIESLCDRYHNSPSTPLQEPVLEALETSSPRLEVQLRDGQSMGGGGGDPFRYRDRENAVRRRRRLVLVGLNTGRRVDQIRLRYHQEPVGDADEWLNEIHGGTCGASQDDIELGKAVSILRIQAQSGIPNGRVDQLWLTMGDGQRIGGGKGYDGDTPMDWQPSVNQVLLGFNGRSKAELDSLKAVIATFGPLAWESVQVEEDP